MVRPDDTRPHPRPARRPGHPAAWLRPARLLSARQRRRLAAGPTGRPTALALAAAALLGLAPTPRSEAAACVFGPAAGNWAVAGNWSCGVVPSGPVADSATIAAGKTVTVNDARSIFSLSNAGTLTLDAFLLTLQGGGSTTNTGTLNVGGASTAALQMSHSIANTGGVIHVANGSVLNQFSGGISGGTVNTSGTGAVVAFANSGNSLSGLTLNGRLDLTGAGAQMRLANVVLNGSADVASGSRLYLDGTAGASSLTGTASIQLAPGANLHVEGSGNQTLGANVLVHGAGTFGQAIIQSGTPTVTNLGRISADANGATLNVVPMANIGSLVNQNVMDALGGGTLQLSTTVSQSGAGRVTADNGGTVLLNGAGVVGGLLNSLGTGLVKATNNFANFLSGVSLTGTADLAGSASQLRIRDGLALNGTVSVGASSVLYLDNRNTTSQAITGTGAIVLDGGALRMEGTGDTSTAAGIAVRGHGTVGQATSQSGAYTWVNNGLVSADVAGQTLNLVAPANGSVPIQNNGILEALNGGRLLLSANIDAGASAQMRAGTGSVIEMNGVRVTGTVNTTGTGSFRASNTSTNLLSGVALNGNVDLASQASQLRISDSLTLNGSIAVGGASSLYLDNRTTATQSLGGTGSIVLEGAALRMEGTGTTTTGANITVRGHGNIGQAVLLSGAHTWVNNGLVSADVAGQTLQIQRPGNGGVAVQNNGIFEALNGGRLLLSADVDASVGAQMRAGTGSVIEMNGVRVSGTVNTTGTGSFRASNNVANLLSGVSLNGHIDLASQASQLRISDGLTLNGGIAVGPSSSLYIDNRSTTTQALGGTGSIVLDGAALRFEGAGQTTLGSGVTVRGAGTVGQAVLLSGAHQLVLNGSLVADVAGQTLNLVPIGNGGLAVQHNGLMQASGGGTLQLGTGVAGGAGSRYDVEAGSRILMNGVTLSGVVNQTGSGAIEASNTSSNALRASTLTGRVNVGTGGGGQLRITDGLAMNSGATLTVGPSGALYFDNRATVDQTLSGSGQIVMNSGTLRFEGGSSTTWGAGVTVRGSGAIGQAVLSSANQTLVNHGSIVADGGALTINAIANAGALQGTGTLRVDGGALTLATGKTTEQGTLDIRGAGTLALGNQHLLLSADYTNAQAGSGNGFDRRAGVSGSGQIRAAGDGVQVISGTGGATVTGGNTANATLSIGNVHVGANTVGYTIGNGGSTGPALRGALQTNVNGANLTDARLSGSGVTAGNYNAGGPGGAGSAQSLTFTAATAGALAPLSGQVLNLRSAYENIADQKLNIVVGAGAAAYHLASGSAPAAVSVANQRVGGSATVGLNIGNTAAAGAFSEDLNAVVASVSGPVVGSGAVNGLLAGASAGGITVGLATGSAGAKTGTVNLGYTSTGTVNGVANGLGATAVGGQAVTVSGNVYQAAAGQLVGSTLNFGTLQVGQAISQNLVVRNTATGPSGFVEDLNASFGAAGNGQISGAGSLAGIRAGQTSTGANGTMTVTVTGATAGALNSAIAVNYFSAGAVDGVSNGLGLLGVGSENFGVSGTITATASVVNQASPLLGTTSVNLGAVRVGAAAPTATIALTNQSTAAPQAALSASITSNGAPVTASGSVSLLAPGATSNALQVGLNTAVAGNYTGANTGSATVGLVSDASNIGGCAPDCALSLAPQTVNVSGKVYTQAQGQLVAPTTLNFGIVRVGDTPSAKNITVHNAAAVTALNDSLSAQVSGLAGPFSSAGGVTGVAAQANGTVAVNLSTAAAGVFSGTATVAFSSHNDDMADIAAGADASVSVLAQINQLANANFSLLSGAGLLTRSGDDYVLDLGTLSLGSNGHWSLSLGNDVSGTADDLTGLFDLSGADDFGLGGWGLAGVLQAGDAQTGLDVDFSAAVAGLYEDTIVFNGRSINADDTAGVAEQRRLLVRANVVDAGGGGGGGSVPEPGTWALLLLAALAATCRRARRTAPQGVAPV